jgi:hypothetical protein
MTENYNEMKCNTFEAIFKFADYLQYKGINTKTFTDNRVQSTEYRVQNRDTGSFT